jgi:hypothetical protein
MIGRRAIAGLSLLSALLFCAFAAQSALATETKPANTTAFTCVSSGGSTNKDFKDAHCDEQVEPGKGSFEHKAIANGSHTLIAATNVEPAVLKAKTPGGAATITCTTVKNNETESFVENSEPEPGTMRLKGTAKTEFSNCAVTELSHCVVAEPIVSMAEFEGVNEFKRAGVNVKGPKGEEKPMGIKFTGEGGTEKNRFAEIEFKTKSGEKTACALAAKTFPVTGSAIATSGLGTEAKQDNKSGGSTLVFTPKFEMETLKLGEESATFETITTPTMASSGNPISATTP